MIEIKDVSKKYGKHWANDHLSFSVPQGEISVLLGPNGAGKSTLIKSVVGLLRHEGTITVDGHSNRSVEAKKILGFVPEMPAVYDLLTVWEHLEFIARAYGLHDWQPTAEMLLNRLEMADKREKLGKELSKGMQQKLSIMCAMLPRPTAIVLDEPLVGLDPHAIKELKNILREWRDQGHTILVSTHMIDSVEQDWDAAFILMNGRLVATMRREQETDRDTLEKLFFQVTDKPASEAIQEGGQEA